MPPGLEGNPSAEMIRALHRAAEDATELQDAHAAYSGRSPTLKWKVHIWLRAVRGRHLIEQPWSHDSLLGRQSNGVVEVHAQVPITYVQGRRDAVLVALAELDLAPGVWAYDFQNTNPDDDVGHIVLAADDYARVEATQRGGRARKALGHALDVPGSLLGVGVLPEDSLKDRSLRRIL